MQPFGHLLVIVAFFTTLLTALTALYGAATRSDVLVRGARYGVYGNAFLYLCTALLLWHGYFTHEYGNKYIATYSDNEMPFIYLFTSFWGGEKGALLFWTTVLTGFSAIAVHHARRKDVAYLGWAAGILMLAVFFFDILMVFESNPFETFLTSVGPRDGDGLNPLLQNPTMAIHPPSLLTGYIAFTLPFAFGAAALITGRLDDEWAKDTRKWTIVSWLFLTTGLILGGAWAYQELGWGGFWMWDPVENAGLIPWFTATAFLHSIMVQERRGMLRRWNFTLVCLTFLLTIFGTFLTRSQLIVSIHAFADSKLSEYFLIYMGVIALVAGGLLIWRWAALKSEDRIESFWSRESMFVLNNVVLLICAFVVMWGTLFSKLSGSPRFQSIYNVFAGAVRAVGIPIDLLTQARDLGEPWFNKVMVPLGIVLLALTAFGPLFPWRRTTLAAFKKTILTPFVWSTALSFGGLVSIATWRVVELASAKSIAFGAAFSEWRNTLLLQHVYAFLGIWMAIFVLTGIFLEFWQVGRVRQKAKGGWLLVNMMAISLKAKRRYGGYLIHTGFVCAFLGFVGSAYKSITPETPLHPGDTIDCGGYRLTFTRMHDEYRAGEGFAATQAAIVALRPGETVPVAEVDRVSEFVQSRTQGAFHVETRPDSAKVFLRFGSANDRDTVREELYLRSELPANFTLVSEEPAMRRLWLTFKDQNLLGILPMLVMKHVDELRRTLGSLENGRATVETVPGQARFSVTWETAAGYTRARALLRESGPALEGVLLSRVNPSEDALEIVTDRTGYLLLPEVRFYKKHPNPTTEVAIWSRPWEDLSTAMRPEMGKPFVQLLTVGNPMIMLLWLGAAIMFGGGVFLLFPTELFVARARKTIEDDPPVRPARRPIGATSILPVLLVALFAGRTAQAVELPDMLRCVCEEAGERVYSDTKTLRDCDCPLGKSLQKRTLDFLKIGPTQEAQIAFLETLAAEDPANERLVIYPVDKHAELMKNTLCTCGCGKMALSQCPLDCPWSPVWQRKFKLLLGLGMSVQDARKIYTVEANKAHRVGQPQLVPDDVLMNKDDAMSWALPVGLGAGAAAVLVSFIVMRTRSRRRQPPAPPPAAPPTVSAVDRELLRDELDDLGT